eukprot:COSAG01_NODE_6129_length_3835_cov_2.876907_6_plen_103_part_00
MLDRSEGGEAEVGEGQVDEPTAAQEGAGTGGGSSSAADGARPPAGAPALTTTLQQSAEAAMDAALEAQAARAARLPSSGARRHDHCRDKLRQPCVFILGGCI